ncbi:hypothetical protein EAI_01739 [Harpegnathos saltator]|uniref:Uncharacterized protein n=2 Tax=Harpegnathos saltator TaxID=610380 RepID=E2B490_HARSA|nr:hypothetical protein EAI_01739 [Harpegnathos saltator]
MDEMDLQKALDRIQNEFEGNASAPVAKERADMSQRSAQRCFRSRFSAVFDGIRVRFGQREHAGESSVMI